MIIRTFCVVAVVAAAGGCASPTGPSTALAFTKADLVVGSGNTADTGESITVDYTGWFYDASKSDHKGLQFDSSIGASPFTFTLGAGDVIAGWDQGVPGMMVGGVRQLVIPPSLAYGQMRSGIVPANTALLFEITLLDAP